MNQQTTVGLEIEFQHLPRAAVEGINWLRFNIHDDGSIRGNTWRAGTLAVYPLFGRGGEPIVTAGMSPGERIGLELTTDPYPLDEMMEHAKRLAKVFGHVPQTPRTSIHVHVDVAGEPWRYIQRVLKIAYHFEAPLLRMSCGGHVHRGERVYAGEPNDHRYARPLSNPIGLTWGSSAGPLIRWNDLMEADTASEFVAAWGRLDWWWTERNLQHYCPHRLHMLNLASVMRQGTMEWRLFDGLYTQLPNFVELVGAVHRLADAGFDPDFAPITLGSKEQNGVGVDWVSSVLGIDCAPMWGRRWPAPCIVNARRSHYPDAPRVFTVRNDPVHKIMVRGSIDDGSSTFPLYVRR